MMLLRVHWLARTVAVSLVVAAAALAAVPARAETRVSTGSLPDGTAYRIDVPDPWNGVLLIGLDYAAGGDRPSPQTQALLARGYAMAGTTRLVTGWAVEQSIANQLATIDIVVKMYVKPQRTIVLGSSLGAHTGAATIQARPDRFDGAVLMCGGLAGAVPLWNSKLDALFVARTLLFPADTSLPIVGIPDDFAMTTRPAWLKALAAAQETPVGRARIALAAVLAQLPTWSDPRKPQPAASDLAGLQAGLYDSLAGGPLPAVGQAMSSRNEIERRSGGNISSNVGVDYARQLAQVRGSDLVRELYRQAGLDLAADLDALRRAPRVTAEPKALRWTAAGTWDGKLAIPVLTVNGIGDNISPVAGQQAYEAAVRAAGKSEMLRQVYTNTAGHCGFSAAEGVAAVETLMARLKTGEWGDTTNPHTMNALAQSLNLGAARFVPYIPDVFVRAANRPTAPPR
jgi:pimeloyl-ACP methyl ester carboxylesterase